MEKERKRGKEQQKKSSNDSSEHYSLQRPRIVPVLCTLAGEPNGTSFHLQQLDLARNWILRFGWKSLSAIHEKETTSEVNVWRNLMKIRLANQCSNNNNRSSNSNNSNNNSRKSNNTGIKQRQQYILFGIYYLDKINTSNSFCLTKSRVNVEYFCWWSSRR